MSLRLPLAVVLLGLTACASAQVVEPPPEAAAPSATPRLDALQLDPAKVDPAKVEATRRTFTLERGELVLPSPIEFQPATATLKPESDEALEHLKAFLAEKESITTVRIEGHTDAEAADGQALSERRALAVTKWLTDHGVACTRLVAVGFGATKPVAPNDTPEHKMQNRRITVAMAAMRGHAIGGMPIDGGGRVAGDSCR